MWYLFRAGPTDREARYVTSFPSLSALEMFVHSIADEGRKKLVERRFHDGTQFIIKDHATTLQSLANAVTYYASETKKAPPVREVEYRAGDRKVAPGEHLPSPSLKVG